MDIKKDFEEGDIIFIYVGSWISKIINLTQTGKFNQKCPSHVAVVSGVYANMVVLTEATLRGVKITNLDRYKNVKTWHKRIKKPKDMQKGLIFLNEQLNIPYDYMQLVGMIARTFFRLFGKRAYQKSKTIKNFLDSKQKFVCSELTGMFIKEVTGKEPWRAHLSQITPFDLWRSQLLDDVS